MHVGRKAGVEVVHGAAEQPGGVAGRDRLGKVAGEEGDCLTAPHPLGPQRPGHAVDEAA